MSSSEGDSKSVLQGVANFVLRPIGFALSLVVAALFLLVPILFLRGMVWVFEHANQWLLTAASRVTDICVFILFPLSIFKRTRPLAGFGFLLSSLLFGTALFGLSCVIAFGVWGYTGLILGLLFGIIGVIPVAFLAALFHPESVTFWPLPVGVVLTIGTQWLGGRLLERNTKSEVAPTQASLAHLHSTPNEHDLSGLAVRHVKRILVSHEEAVNEVIEEILSSAGHEVKTTTHPSEVLGLVREFAPDFALIKLVTPEVNGLDLSEQLVVRFPKVKIVIVGPFCDLKWTETYLQERGIGCKFLDAPFSRNELLDVVES